MRNRKFKWRKHLIRINTLLADLKEISWPCVPLDAYGWVAQSVEHVTENHSVSSAILLPATKLLGFSISVLQGTLTPLRVVRLHQPQPFAKTVKGSWLKGDIGSDAVAHEFNIPQF